MRSIMERGRSWPAALAIAATTTLSGCASLPAPEANAFRTLATADVRAFDDLRSQDQEGRVALAQSLFADDEGVIGIEACGGQDLADCTVTYSIPGAPRRKLRAPGAYARGLLGSVVRYAGLMADLAEAKDLVTVAASAEGAAGAIKTLASVAGVAGAIPGVIIDGAVFAANAGLREKRRRAMLKNAEAARPAIASAAVMLDRISELMAANVRDGAANRIKELDQAIEADRLEERRLRARRRDDVATVQRIELLRQRRTATLAGLVAATDAMNRARAPRPPFARLVKAHDLLIDKLRNPRASTEEAMADITAVLTILDELAPTKDRR